MRDWLFSAGLRFADNCTGTSITRAATTMARASAEVSAWAGIHYFACRNGEALERRRRRRAHRRPRCNAWLVERLAAIDQRTHAGDRLLSWRDGRARRRQRARRWNRSTRRRSVAGEPSSERCALRIVAEQLIWAAPRVPRPARLRRARRELKAAAASFTHAPWLVANLTLSRLPRRSRAGVATRVGQRPLRQRRRSATSSPRTNRCACGARRNVLTLLPDALTR
jgi:hypothetical protein